MKATKNKPSAVESHVAHARALLEIVVENDLELNGRTDELIEMAQLSEDDELWVRNRISEVKGHNGKITTTSLGVNYFEGTPF